MPEKWSKTPGVVHVAAAAAGEEWQRNSAETRLQTFRIKEETTGGGTHSKDDEMVSRGGRQGWDFLLVSSRAS